MQPRPLEPVLNLIQDLSFFKDSALNYISSLNGPIREKNQSLKNRFEVLIKDTSFFDCLVGYFYTSGFHVIYKSLENTEKIRVLIGISTNKKAIELIQKAITNQCFHILAPK